MLPSSILRVWFLALLSLALLAAAVYFGFAWQVRSWTWDDVQQRPIFHLHLDTREDLALCVTAVSLATIVLFGGPIVRVLLRVFCGIKGSSRESPWTAPEPDRRQRVPRFHRCELQVELYGPPDGIPIVLTHGWGMDSTEWNYLKQHLSKDFRLIVWDAPGMGKSTCAANRDFSMEAFAAHLDAVLSLAANKPAILVGHSIGGMAILTFCRLFPGALARRVAGLVLAHTTPTNPLRTTAGAAFYQRIEKPVIVPLMYLTMMLSPLLRILNRLSYRNGSAHLATKRSSFGGTETWQQIDFAAQFQVKASPAVLARGMLAMLRYDARDVLPKIPVPTLVVAANRDRTTRFSASEAIRSGIPHAELLTLAPAKHLGLLEHHTKFEAALREFALHVAAPVFQ